MGTTSDGDHDYYIPYSLQRWFPYSKGQPSGRVDEVPFPPHILSTQPHYEFLNHEVAPKHSSLLKSWRTQSDGAFGPPYIRPQLHENW